MPLVSLLIGITGKTSAKPRGRRGGGDATQTSVWYLKERGKNRAHERKKSNGIVLRVINRGIRLLFHLMQNKMSYSFNCVFGELSRTRG